ncbi:MAG: YbaB/EbfC family nucleoid-associated protein [Nocardioidaceae bacterium]
MTSSEWLDSYQQNVTDITERAQEARAQLQEISATLTSSDGAATVTVNASGALQKLSFESKAESLSREQLAASVLATARRAQTQAAQQVTAVMTPLIGQDSDAMHFLEEQIPAPEESEASSRPSEPDTTGLTDQEADDFIFERREWE